MVAQQSSVPLRAVVLLAAGVIGFSLLLAADVGATAEAPPTDVYVVEPGDTLWEIAGVAGPDQDLRAVVEQISEINSLDSGLIRVGQELLVPRSG